MSKGGKRRKGWGDTQKSSAFQTPIPTAGGCSPVQVKVRIDPNGERATHKQVAYLASLRSDLPTEVLPQLSKRQASTLIEAAKG